VKDGINIKQVSNSANSRGAVKSKRKSGVITGIIAGAVVVILAGGTVGAGFYINNLDTVFPNISVAGVDLSGLTLSEAEKALTDAGYENSASKISVTVLFPNGERMTINGKDSGVKLQAGQAAQIAYDYGKNGSFFENELAFVQCLFKAQDLDQTSAAGINETYIRSVVNDYVNKFNERILRGAYTITETGIEIVKGSNSALADAEEVYKLVVAALGESLAQNKPVELEYSVGSVAGESVNLESLYDAIHTEPVEAVYDRTTGQVTQSKVGLSFDIKSAQQMLDAAKPGSTVFIPLIRTEPAVSTEQLQAMLFRDVLSEKATYVDGTSNRVHNVKLASQALDGTILNPGDVFSYNETLGERTREKGYKEAGAYVNGNVVQEVGGGICQGSSTLYYCVLYADLEVVERSNHMFTVGYLPLGHDATVNWGTVDFKFKNNTDYPIKIEAIYKDRFLTIRLLGTKTHTNRVEIKYEVISSTEIKTVQKEDPSIEPGTSKVSQAGHKGYVVDTYKYIYDENNNLISKTYIKRSSYKMQEREVLVPVGTLTSPPPTSDAGTSPPPTDAIPADPVEPSEPPPSQEPPPQPSESADPPSD